MLKYLFNIKTDFLQCRLERLSSFPGAESDGVFYGPQRIQRLVTAVDFKYRVIFDEIEAKVACMLVTTDVIAVHMDMWMFLVKND